MIRESQFEIVVELSEKSEDISVLEKLGAGAKKSSYLKKGPAARIKSNVTPVKIKMRHAKTGTEFYKTYYVKGKKRDAFRKKQMEEIASGVDAKKTSYLTYTDQLDDMFGETKGMPKSLVSKHKGWTTKVTQLSGAYNGFMDKMSMINKSQRRIDHRTPNAKAVQDPTNPNITRIRDEVLMDDLNGVDSKGNPNRTSMYTNATYTEKGDGSVDFHYLSGLRDLKLAELEPHNDGWRRRVIGGTYGADGKSMTIKNVGKMKSSELGYFMAGHERKFRTIDMEINAPNAKSIKAGGKGMGNGTEHLLTAAHKLGFSAKEDTAKNWDSMKKSVADYITTNYNPRAAEKLLKILKDSSTMSAYFFGLGEKKQIGRGISDDMVKGYLQKIGAKKLTWTGSSRKRTKSSHMLHSHNLQKAPENDYHKGFITDYNIESPREVY